MRNRPKQINIAMAEFMADLSVRLEAPDQLIRTGFSDLDEQITGLRPGSLVIIAGRPSMGKSCFALNIASHVALEQGLPVVIFSMEQSGMQVALRVLGQIGKFSWFQLRTEKLGEHDWEKFSKAQEKLNDAEIYVDDTANLNSNQICSRVRDFYAQHGRLGLIVVDYWQLMSEQSSIEIMPSLQNLAREVNAPVVVISQLRRRLEKRKNKRPVLSDLRELELAQNADMVIFVYREEVYNPDSRDRGKAEIILCKNRFGPLGSVKLSFNGEFGNFENMNLSTCNDQRIDTGARVKEFLCKRLFGRKLPS